MVVELVHLIDDISMPVKLGWVGVLVWAAVQVMWYRRGRVLPEEIEAQGEPEGWSLGSLLERFRRSPDEAGDAPSERAGALSIAAALDFPVRSTPREDSELGEAAGMALESLLEDGESGPGALEDGTDSAKCVSYQSSLSY